MGTASVVLPRATKTARGEIDDMLWEQFDHFSLPAVNVRTDVERAAQNLACSEDSTAGEWLRSVKTGRA